MIHNRKLLFALLITLFAVTDGFGVTRVGRSYNMLRIYGGPSISHGNYSGLPGTEFINFEINNRLVHIPSDSIYGTGFNIGGEYGTLRQSRFLVTLGAQFSDYNLKDTISLPFDTILFFDGDAKLRQFDVQLGVDYFIADPSKVLLAPYVGFGVRAGLASFSVKGFDSENDANLATYVSFGFDLRLWENKRDGSILSLSSANSWNFMAVADRPTQIQLGGGLRYWFRM